MGNGQRDNAVPPDLGDPTPAGNECGERGARRVASTALSTTNRYHCPFFLRGKRNRVSRLLVAGSCNLLLERGGLVVQGRTKDKLAGNCDVADAAMVTAGQLPAAVVQDSSGLVDNAGNALGWTLMGGPQRHKPEAGVRKAAIQTARKAQRAGVAPTGRSPRRQSPSCRPGRAIRLPSVPGESQGRPPSSSWHHPPPARHAQGTSRPSAGG